MQGNGYNVCGPLGCVKGGAVNVYMSLIRSIYSHVLNLGIVLQCLCIVLQCSFKTFTSSAVGPMMVRVKYDRLRKESTITFAHK